MTSEEAAQLLGVGPEAEMGEVTRSFYRVKDRLLASTMLEQERAAYERAVLILRVESVKRAAQAERDPQEHLPRTRRRTALRLKPRRRRRGPDESKYSRRRGPHVRHRRWNWRSASRPPPRDGQKPGRFSGYPFGDRVAGWTSA